eukprot:scaffold13809_cov69-Skeletonema_menzelii.AAC.3
MATWVEQKHFMGEILQLLSDQDDKRAEDPYTIESVESFRMQNSHIFGRVEKEVFYSLYKRAHCENLLRLQLSEHHQKSQDKRKRKEQRSISKTKEDPPTKPQQQPQRQSRGQKKERMKKSESETTTVATPRRKDSPMPNQLRFPHRVVPFSMRTHQRVHVHIYPAAGFHCKDISSISVVDGAKLLMRMRWPKSFLSTDKIYSHPQFSDYFHDEHPKIISCTEKTDALVGIDGFIESDFVIDLPHGNEYLLTDPLISGHDNFVPILIEDENIEDEKKRKRCAMVVWLIDLTMKSEDKSTKYSQREVHTMDDESEDELDNDDIFG